MKIFTKRDKRTDIDKEIDRLTTKLGTLDPITDKGNYNTVNAQRKTLVEGKSFEKKEDHTQLVNTLIVAGVGLLQFGLLIYHEEFHVITSKGLGLIVKGRV